MKKLLVAGLLFWACDLYAAYNLVFTSHQIAIKAYANGLKYVVLGEYLKLNEQSLPPIAAAKKFNVAAKQLVENEIELYKKKLEEKAYSPQRMQYLDEGKQSSLDIEMTMVSGSKDEPISITLQIDELLPGQHAPSQTIKTVNFDAKGDVMSLTDIFAPDSKYLEAISKYCAENLPLKVSGELKPDGFSPKLENFQVWNIKHQGITFTFNEGQVASKKKGTLYITIPYEYLHDYLKQDLVIPSV